MKELSTEEKAQAYDEALERAKKLQETCDSTTVVGWCEYIFPELRESEDELTWLTKYIEEEAYSLSMDIRDNEDRIKLKNLQRSLAWLEKQGEQKSAAWSEEDEKEYKYVLKFVDNILNNCGNKKDYEHCKRCYDWLKSFKERYTWKPSGEQMNALWDKISNDNLPNSEKEISQQVALTELYEQLKKLKGE